MSLTITNAKLRALERRVDALESELADARQAVQRLNAMSARRSPGRPRKDAKEEQKAVDMRFEHVG